jgi:hypothetical protein
VQPGSYILALFGYSVINEVVTITVKEMPVEETPNSLPSLGPDYDGRANVQSGVMLYPCTLEIVLKMHVEAVITTVC